MSTWEYTPEEAVGEHYGTPVNRDNYFISREQPPSDLITKAKLVLTELFALLDRLDIDIAVDSEQQVVVLYTEYEDKLIQWTVNYSDRQNAVIAFNGFPAGTLVLLEKEW